MSLTHTTPDCTPHPTHHGYVAVPINWMPDDMRLRRSLMGFSMPCDECPTRECGWEVNAIASNTVDGTCGAGLANVWVSIETAVTLRMNQDALDDIARR